MKKTIYILAALMMSVAKVSASDNPFDETFDGMFDTEPILIDIPTGDGPPPPVPLDGGLTALLLAGGAAGYRQYKKKRA